MSNRYIKDFRLKLFNESPYCRKCGVKTILANSPEYNGEIDSVATIQHNLPKSHPNYSKDLTLWCYKCNHEDSIFKQQHKILSREEFLYEILGGKRPLNGYYIIDGVICFYAGHRLIIEMDSVEFKLKMLNNYMSYFIYKLPMKKKLLSFQKFLDNKIKGKFSFKQHYIGDGWYQRKWYRDRMKN